MPSIDILKQWTSNDPLVREQKLSSSLTLTNPKEAKVITFISPIGADFGIEGVFVIPDNYSTAPKIIVRSVLDGTPTGTVAFAYSDNPIANNETVDIAYGVEKTASNAVWTGYVDGDIYLEEITLAAPDYVASDQVFYKLVRDASAEQAAGGFAGRLLIVSAEFSYTAI